MVPIQENDQKKIAFTWEGIQYNFTWLPQAYQHPPTLVHYALAQELAKISPEEGVKVYPYIDDILEGGRDIELVGQTQTRNTTSLENTELQIPPER